MQHGALVHGKCAGWTPIRVSDLRQQLLVGQCSYWWATAVIGGPLQLLAVIGSEGLTIADLAKFGAGISNWRGRLFSPTITSALYRRSDLSPAPGSRSKGPISSGGFREDWGSRFNVHSSSVWW